MQSEVGHIFSLQVSNGGVPKLPIREGLVTELGLQGDQHRDRRNHGGPERALCLYSLEGILRLQSEGHPIYPGSTGENVTITGMDWSTIQVGDCFQLGDEVLVQVTSYTTPCDNIKDSFENGKFLRISQKLHPGESRLYVRVLQPGTVRVGQQVQRVPAPQADKLVNETLRY